MVSYLHSGKIRPISEGSGGLNTPDTGWSSELALRTTGRFRTGESSSLIRLLLLLAGKPCPITCGWICDFALGRKGIVLRPITVIVYIQAIGNVGEVAARTI